MSISRTNSGVLAASAVVLWLALLATGCGDPTAPQEPRQPIRLDEPVPLVFDRAGEPEPEILAEDQELHRGNGEEPQTLDPHRAEGVPTANILRDLFEGLTTTAPDGRIVPGAAGRWDISRDGMIYTFYLREDGRWSNGEPVTAADFVFSFRRSVDPDTAAVFGRMLMPIENAQPILAGELEPEALGVEALNDRTVQIRLDDPTPYFLGLLTHASTYPVHAPSLTEHGDDFVLPGNLISNGAYRLVDWVPRSRIELEASPNYHSAGQVIIDRVLYYPIEDENTEFQRFRAGDLHWTDQVPSNLFDWLGANLPQALSVSPWFGTYYFGFNLTRAPFEQNLPLRRALNLAIDRRILTEKVTQFGEIPTFTLVPDGLPDYEPPVPDYAALDQAEREELAREMYRRAGYSDDDPLEVELRYNTSENHRKIAVAVSAMWKQVLGVRTRLINEEFRVFLQNRAMKRNTEVYRAGWIGDYQDAFTFLELFHSQHPRNDAGYANPRYDRLLEQISTERIPARRRNLMVEAERILLAGQVVMPVYTYVTKRLVSPLLKGWEPNVMDFHPSQQMYFVKSRAQVEAEIEAAPETETGSGEAEDVTVVDEGTT
ncbi:MAG: peptide ABC transporter substrate-binding protein [Wenzhouxiangellaceae bacterium]|jgi:oligopeptide transport system substrate-binding protein|nr:peptide ABC transporter substrate-binding protein [Wenzhouxiangellaceae bacterium]MBS3822502.1 peptide ABC transporter substrate-binding protein [Wenzhouxiangellaceae bacterium]